MDKCSLTPHQENSLQQTETNTENHNKSKCSIVKPSTKRFICSTTPAPKAERPLHKRGQKNCKI